MMSRNHAGAGDEGSSEGRGVEWAGSMTAIDPARHLAVAQWLAARDMWCHVDVIDESYASGRGIALGSVAKLTLEGRVDVHLMVADPFAAAARLLGSVVSRLTVQVEDLPSSSSRAPAEVCASLRKLSAIPELWLAISPVTDPEAIRPYVPYIDGALIMLAPPGVPGSVADSSLLSRLGSFELPCGVDGGVAGPTAVAAIKAGARYVVSGRALLGDGADLDAMAEVFCSPIDQHYKESCR